RDVPQEVDKRTEELIPNPFGRERAEERKVDLERIGMGAQPLSDEVATEHLEWPPERFVRRNLFIEQRARGNGRSLQRGEDLLGARDQLLKFGVEIKNVVLAGDQ